LTQQDKKSVESVCLAFSRLVDSFQNDPVKLQEIASTELLTNLQQLVCPQCGIILYFRWYNYYIFQLVVSPPVISTGTFNAVLRMLSVMCSSCPELAITLLRQNIADTLLFLLTGSTVPNPQDEVHLYNVRCMFHFLTL
jgi:E3 ubiquitin-protein ligase TRIP12